jgi:hypothetical protein
MGCVINEDAPLEWRAPGKEGKDDVDNGANGDQLAPAGAP